MGLAVEKPSQPAVSGPARPSTSQAVGLPSGERGSLPLARCPLGGLCTGDRGPPTYVLVAADQELEDVVHGAHVEDEPQLRDAHGEEAEQQDGAEHAVHEGGRRCGGEWRCSGGPRPTALGPQPTHTIQAYGEAWLASQITSCWMQGWACVRCNAWALDLGHPGVGAELDELLTHSGPQCAHL